MNIIFSLLSVYLNRREPALLALSLFSGFIICIWSLFVQFLDSYLWYVWCSFGELMIIMYCLGNNHPAAPVIGRLSGIALSVHLFTLADYLQGIGTLYGAYPFIIKTVELGQLATCCIYSEAIIKTIKAIEWNKKHLSASLK